MHRKIAMAILALSLGGGFILASPPASAQQQQQQKKVQGQVRGGGHAIAPRGGARTFTPRATRTVIPRGTRTFTPRGTRTVTPRGTRTVIPRGARIVTPRGTRTVIPRGTRTVTPRGGNARVVTSARFRGMPARGAGRARIRGHNYSVWRSGYRVRRGGGWRTFVGLSALGAIMIGSSNYYPYAYISAPQPYCEGLTEDGCELRWQQVETLEGDVIDQCVAYCPWQ